MFKAETRKEVRDILKSKENLTREDEYKVFSFYKETHVEGSPMTSALEDMIVKKYEKFVHSIAERILKSLPAHTKANVEDFCVNGGREGLLTAIRKFDPEKGNRFSTYAYCWVFKEANNAVNNERLISIPEKVRSLLKKYRDFDNAYGEKYGVHPDVNEISLALGIIPADTLELLMIYNHQCHDSLNRKVAQDGVKEADAPELGDLISNASDDNVEEEVIKRDTNRRLCSALKTLNTTDHKIVGMYFGIGEYTKSSLREIAEEVGLSTEGVRGRLNRIYKTLKIEMEGPAKSRAC